jgi:hypothetical protein
MLRQQVACNFPTELRPLSRDRVKCPRWRFLALVDRQPAGEHDPLRVSQQAIAVGQEIPAVTNPAALATAGAPASGAPSVDAPPGRCSSRDADRRREALEGTQMKHPPDHCPTREIVSIEKGNISKKGGAFHAHQ